MSFQRFQFGWLGLLFVSLMVGPAFMQSPIFGQGLDGYIPPAKLDGSRAPKKTPQEKGSQEAEKQVSLGLDSGDGQTTTLFDKLMTEMDNLIPGKLNEDPETKKVVETAIKEFQNRNAKQSVVLFDQLGKANADFPPTDLLLAALSYVVKDQNTGKLLLERAAGAHPDSIGIYSAFARLGIGEGRIADAHVHLEKMKRLLAKPMSQKAKDFYDAQYLDGMIDVAMRQQRFDDARELLKVQFANLPDNPKVLMIAAELEFRNDKIEESLAYLNKLKSSYTKSRAPESILATWYQRMGKQTESDQWVLKAAEKYPGDERVQLEYASWALNKGDFPEATASIKKAEAASKESTFSKNLKAKIAFAQGSYIVASYHYEQLASSSSTNFDASNMHALSLIESKDEKKRQKALEIAIKNYQSLPNNLVAQASLGYIQLRLGNLEQAKVALAKGAKSQRGLSPEIDFFVASVLKAMKEDQKARGVLEIALRHKGFFLYRATAQKMLDELGGPLPKQPAGSPGQATGSGELPVPKK